MFLLSMMTDGTTVTTNALRDGGVTSRKIRDLSVQLAAASRPVGGRPELVENLQLQLEAEKDFMQVLQFLQKLGEGIKDFAKSFMTTSLQGWRAS